MTEYVVAARELGLLAILLALAYWLGRHAPGATTWLVKSWMAEQEKNRAAHREIQDRMDERAARFIETVGKMCRYGRGDESPHRGHEE